MFTTYFGAGCVRRGLTPVEDAAGRAPCYARARLALQKSRDVIQNKNTLSSTGNSTYKLGTRFLKGEKIPGRGSILSMPIHEGACLPGKVAFQPDAKS